MCALQAIEQSGLWDLLPGGRTEQGSSSPYGQYTPRSLQGPSMRRSDSPVQSGLMLNIAKPARMQTLACGAASPTRLLPNIRRQDALHRVSDVT